MRPGNGLWAANSMKNGSAGSAAALDRCVSVPALELGHRCRQIGDRNQYVIEVHGQSLP